VNDFSQVVSKCRSSALAFYVVIKVCRGVILLRPVCGRDDDRLMSCPTKATSLNSYLSVIPKPAEAPAKPLGTEFDVSELDGKRPSHRFRPGGVPPLLMSLLFVGLVTAVLFLLDHKLTLNLVPVAYLIPVIVAATQWGIWPATLASVAGTGAPDFFFPAGTEGATASIALPGSQTKASGLTNE
jgi:hypothetical protein